MTQDFRLTKKITQLFFSNLLGLFVFGCTGVSRNTQIVEEHNAEVDKYIEYYADADNSKKKAVRFIAKCIPFQYSTYDDGTLDETHSLIDSVERLEGINFTRNLRNSQKRKKRGHLDVIHDSGIVVSDSLIQSTNLSFKKWEEVPWANAYSLSHFYKYILPYRISDEPLEYYWKEDCLRRYGHLCHDVTDPVEIARKVEKNLNMSINPAFVGITHQSYSMIMQKKRGRCNDGALIRTMILRALGVPAAIDYVPYWGSSNNSHPMAVVLTPDGKCLNVENLINQKEEFKKDQFGHKTSKIYRKEFEIITDGIIYKNREKEIIPPVFHEFRSIDVTHLYNIDQRNVAIEYDQKLGDIAYLSVFSPKGWVPIAYTKAGKRSAEFQNIGTGSVEGINQEEGIDIGEGIVYLPSFYDGDVIASGNPFILTMGNREVIKADMNSLQKITLTRKYPLKNRIVSFAQSMVGGVIEGANSKNFSDAEILYHINATPPSRTVSIDLVPQKYKYIRYRKGTKGFSIAELSVYDKSGEKLKGEIVANDFFQDDPSLQYIFDGNNLTYFDIETIIDAWVGLKFDSAEEIGRIEFCPRTDDNEITAGDMYELFCWQDDQWLTLGKKRATSHQLEYDNVPTGALLWLRNLTRGKEERPFTYERGKQIWW